MPAKRPSKHKPGFKVGEPLAGIDITERIKIITPVLPSLSPMEGMLYLHLNNMLNMERGDDWRSIRTLTKELGQSESHIKAAMRGLVARGLIERHQDGQRALTLLLMPPDSASNNPRGTPERPPVTKLKGVAPAPPGGRPSALRGSPQRPVTRKRTRNEPGEPPPLSLDDLSDDELAIAQAQTERRRIESVNGRR